MLQPTLKCFAFAALLTLSMYGIAQPETRNPNPETKENKAKPFRVLTNGKRITIQATSTFTRLLVWTSNGHRILEQTKLNTLTYSFESPSQEKILFLLVEFTNGLRYTEKIGVR